MTPEILLTLIVLAFAVWLFISEWVRVDVVGIMMIVLLPLIGLIPGKDAFIGLSSNAVCSIIAVFVIGAGLDKTGVTNRLARPIMKLAGNSEIKIMILVSFTVAVISSMMQNIAATALFLPAALRVAKRANIPASRLCMPVAFASIIGGTITLVGNSPTILLNDLMVLEGKRLEPFGLFTQTPIGLALVIAMLLYFALAGRFVLPAGGGEADKGVTAALMGEYPALETTREVQVPATWMENKSLGELAIQSRFLVTVVAIHHAAQKESNFVPRSTDIITANDTLAVVGKEKNISTLATELGWELKAGLEVFAEDLARTNAGMAETLVSPRSEVIGTTISDSNLKERFQLNPIALVRGRKAFYSGHTHMPLQMGDTVLMQGLWEQFHRLKNLPQPRVLTFSTPLEGEIMRPEKATLALFWLAVALGQAIFFDMTLSVALMSGALGMILTGVLSIDEAYQAVDWMTVFLLGGLIPLGIAFERTGTAAFIADGVMRLLGDPSPIVLLAVVGIMTSFFTLVISNVGATVLLVPLCMNMAVMAGADPRMAALVVGLSASNTFILPTHQCNAFVMRPGGYSTGDYLKAGAIMTAIYLTVEIGMIYLFYGITAPTP